MKSLFPLVLCWIWPPIPAASPSKVTAGDKSQRHLLRSFGPLNPLICSFQTIEEDAQQLHNQSAGKEEGICPLAWENWSKCNKTHSSSIIIFQLHKSQGINQAVRESSCVGISAGGEKMLRPPTASWHAAGEPRWVPVPVLLWFHIDLLPLTSKEPLNHSTINTSRMGLAGSLW